jgi:hypothetical protein
VESISPKNLPEWKGMGTAPLIVHHAFILEPRSNYTEYLEWIAGWQLRGTTRNAIQNGTVNAWTGVLAGHAAHFLTKGKWDTRTSAQQNPRHCSRPWFHQVVDTGNDDGMILEPPRFCIELTRSPHVWWRLDRLMCNIAFWRNAQKPPKASRGPPQDM